MCITIILLTKNYFILTVRWFTDASKTTLAENLKKILEYHQKNFKDLSLIKVFKDLADISQTFDRVLCYIFTSKGIYRSFKDLSKLF